ncbi:MAG: hypothetical protein WDO24_02790 [Pseudomonadota bacterium]
MTRAGRPRRRAVRSRRPAGDLATIGRDPRGLGRQPAAARHAAAGRGCPGQPSSSQILTEVLEAHAAAHRRSTS